MKDEYKIFIYDKEIQEYVDFSNRLQLPFSINEKADDRYDSGILTLTKLERSKPFEIRTPVKIELYNESLLLDTYSMFITEDNIQQYYLGKRPYYNHTISISEHTQKFDDIYLPGFSVTNPATKTIVQGYDKIKTQMNPSLKETRVISNNKYYTSMVSNKILFDTTYKDSSTSMTSEISLTKIPNLKNGLDRLPFTSQSIGEIISLPIPYCDINDFIGIKHVFSLWNKGYIHGLAPGGVYDYYPKDLVYEKDIKTLLLKYSYSLDFGERQNLCEIRYNIESGEYNLTDTSLNDYTYISNNQLYFDTTKFNKSGKIRFFIEATFELSLNDILDDNLRDLISYRFLTELSSKKYASGYGSTAFLWLEYKAYLAAYNAYKDKYQYNDVWLNYLETARTLINKDQKDQLTGDDYRALSEAIMGLLLYTDYSVSSKVRFDYHDAGITSQTNTFSEKISDNYNVAEYALELDITEEKTQFNVIPISSGDYKTIKDVLEKINAMLEDNDKYIIDPTLSNSDILNATVPERIYTKRNVSEILFELGNLISAYPYLNEDNILTFKKVIPEDNPIYSNKDTSENVDYTNENAIDNYVSSVSNMITIPDKTSGIYSYWPDKYNFSYSNGNAQSSSVTPDSNQIEVSNSSGIYYLKYIKVKNCISKTEYDENGVELYGPNTAIDITNFCPEETYYQSLFVIGEGSLSNTNKSNCIYWTKGSNKIQISELEAQEKVSIFGGDKPENYKIMRAILNAFLTQFPYTIDISAINPNIIDYQYQICYVDYIDGLIYNKKFNQNKIHDITSNYNQTDNLINSQSWFNTSQINILRRGNTELKKSIIIKDLKERPLLGEVYYKDNDMYLADSVDYTFDNNTISVTMNYTKNYNKIDPSVSLSKDYRQFEIYADSLIDRTVNINRYIYLENSKDLESSLRIDATNAYKKDSRYENPAYMALFFKDSNMNPISYWNLDVNALEKIETKGILVPVTTAASGNTILFKASLLDNFCAGYKQDTSEKGKVGYIDLFGNPQDSGARRVNEARYVDDLGEAEYVSVYLLKGDALTLSQNVFNKDLYPNTSLSEEEIRELSIDYKENILLKKDNRERLIFIYQLHYLTYLENLKWNPAICKYLFYDVGNINDILGDSEKPKVFGIKYKMTTDITLPYKIISEKYVYDSSYSTPLNIDIDISNGGITSSTSIEASEDYEGYALVYPGSLEIIYHIDKKIRKGDTITIDPIYFNYSDIKK